MTLKVLVVDDSAVVRTALVAALGTDPKLQVTAVADPIFAQQRMRMSWPDVIILDIEMPRMDGLTFLRGLMAQRPTPVIICSTLTARGAETSLQALAAGAFSVVEKPRLAFRDHAARVAAELVQLVRSAARANLRNLSPAVPAVREAPAPSALAETTESVIAIGTSTGGTIALEHVLAALPITCPGVVIVQHMPEKFTSAFASRLDSICAIEVREAADHDRVLPGRALIAPGGRHMQLKRSGAQYHVQVRDGPAVNRHKPSVDVLFKSVAQVAGSNAVGVIMTGMGDDGALGLKAMREAGAWTLAQDEASCVVFGMPKEAIRMDAVDRVVSLGAIAAEVLRRREARR